MSKNALFDYLQRHESVAKRRRPRIPLVGGAAPSAQRRTEYLQPFSVRMQTFSRPREVFAAIRSHPHPLDILVDASVFAPERLDVVRELLATSVPMVVLPEVVAELAEMNDERTRDLRDVVFPKGKLSTLLRAESGSMLRGHLRVASKLVNLLHMRREFIRGPLRRFREEHGRDAHGGERHAIMQKALSDGISQRTLRLANKGDDLARFTDEVLAVHCVLAPILSGRDCVVLTADADLADHVFELHLLLNEQYGSMLIAEDFRANPERYRHQHEEAPGFMQPGAVAYGRSVDTRRLLPSVARTCASWVLNLANMSSFICVATRDVARTLALQNSSETQRAADDGAGHNVHISWADTPCRSAKAHFVVGDDAFAFERDSPHGRIYVSRFELAAVLSEKARRTTPPRRVWMPGLPET